MSDHGRDPEATKQQQQQQQQQQASPSPPHVDAHGQDASYHDHVDEPGLPPFDPIHTLLTNSSTNETIHPHVRYLFADDDPASIIAHEAELDAATDHLGAHRTLIVDLVAPAAATATATTTIAGDGHLPSSTAADPNNWSVSWAASLSPDFAVTDSQLRPMQQEGGGDVSPAHAIAGAGAHGGLMLRISGVEREPVDPRPHSARGGSGSGSSSSSLPQASVPAGREDLDALVDDFRRRMGVLQRVVAEGERRRDAVRAEDEQQPDDPAIASGSVPPRAGSSATGGSPGLAGDHHHMQDSG